MATADRLLGVLGLLSAREHWTARELADRLEITERTVRRDVDRLRSIGYPIAAAPGVHGGYRLGAGGRLPPLLLDDDEALAIAVSLAAVAGTGSSGLELPAVSALTKLDRVLPPRLRERAAALRNVTLGLARGPFPAVDTTALVTLALACQRPERLHFEYVDHAERASHRLVEPYRLVFTDRRWYLVARDTGRDAWRTFRVDRMTDLAPTGVPFEHGELPDAARQVAEGVAVRAFDTVATVRVDATRARVEQLVPPTVGVIDGEDGAGVVVRLGGDAEWIARLLCGWEERYQVLEPAEVRDQLRAIGRRLVRDHPPTRRAGRRRGSPSVRPEDRAQPAQPEDAYDGR